jgi:hypothetical protein
MLTVPAVLLALLCNGRERQTEREREAIVDILSLRSSSVHKSLLLAAATFKRRATTGVSSRAAT